MPEKRIEDFIGDALSGDAQKNALDFVSYLSTCEMLFERCKGYWEDKLYWMIKYKDECVCYILIYSSASSEDSTEPWVIWSDDSGSNWFEDFPLDEHLKEIAWKNVDTCVGADVCGGCNSPGGASKIIFGKYFNNACGTTFRFENPDAEVLECVKKLMEIRKNYILKYI